jgi:hypothetical protein
VYLYVQCRLAGCWPRPPVCYSLKDPHTDSPRGIWVYMQTRLASVMDIAFRVARQSLPHPLMLHGHAPNTTIVQILLRLSDAAAAVEHSLFAAVGVDSVRFGRGFRTVPVRPRDGVHGLRARGRPACEPCPAKGKGVVTAGIGNAPQPT